MSKVSIFIEGGGSTDGPGVFEESPYGPVSAYDLLTIPAGRIAVLEYISATVWFGSEPYPEDRIGDIGLVGFKLNGKEHFHAVPFFRKEPGAMLVASQALPMHAPPGAQVIVKVPVIPNQSGGASITLSGYQLQA